MTCKDCLHYDRCKKLGICNIETLTSCEDFANRSEWVQLPKVGDKLYKVVPDLKKPRGNMTIQEYTVSGIIASVIVFKPYNVFNMYRNRIGVDIFLTRKQAEKVLEEKQNGYK